MEKIFNRQKLIPVQVPWMIDAATPYLRLFAAESGSDRSTHVTFIADFRLESEIKTPQGARVFFPPYDTNIKLGPQSGRDQIVTVTFECAICSRMLPSHSDGDTVNPALFDFSMLPADLHQGQAVEEWLQSFHESWAKLQRCPDPRMYEVQNSSWLREICDEKNDATHFLLLGHDAYVEVIAKSWQWRSDGSF